MTVAITTYRRTTCTISTYRITIFIAKARTVMTFGTTTLEHLDTRHSISTYSTLPKDTQRNDILSELRNPREDVSCHSECRDAECHHAQCRGALISPSLRPVLQNFLAINF